MAALLGVLERGGVVAGCSAGAMIWGAWLPRPRGLRLWTPAFGLVPEALIVPHFDEFPAALPLLLRLALGRRTLVGIEGGTALVLTAGQPTVAGRGGVTVWGRRARTRYTAGQPVVFE